jgi:hypothetical protein
LEPRCQQPGNRRCLELMQLAEIFFSGLDFA